jgi:hypothetical protein
MNIQSSLSGHWTDEQIIEHLYTGEPGDGHILSCTRCLNRLHSIQENRRRLEEAAQEQNEPTAEFLMSQRRRIYARLDPTPSRRASAGIVRRWASTGIAVLILGGGLLLFEDGSRLGPHSKPGQQAATSKISDSQLASDVSQMADASEPGPTEPLQALFTE